MMLEHVLLTILPATFGMIGFGLGWILNTRGAAARFRDDCPDLSSGAQRVKPHDH